MTVPNIDQMTADRPEFTDIESQMISLMNDFKTADSTESRIAVIKHWDEIRSGVSTWNSLTGLHFNQDTRNEEFKKERDYRDALSPKLTNLHNSFKDLLLTSPGRDELQAKLGPQAFAKWQMDADSFKPEIEEDQVAISKLTAEYTELLANAEFEFKGEKLNLSSLGKYTLDDDRQTRYEANKIRWQWFADNSDALDTYFDKLTKLRHGTAQKLGCKDYIELGYKRMHRIDYNREDIKNLRSQIVSDVVPLVNELVERQRKDLRVDSIMSWDNGVWDAKGSPRPHGDHDWMVNRAVEMFDDVGHGLGEFFRLMKDRGLLDLKSREGKAGGGFCTSFPKYGVPFVFANFNGTDGDVRVFTHEIGHAFQNYSSQGQKLLDYHWPTYESAEIHSMSLEFITWPWMEKFFEEDADRFRYAHLASGLAFLPYGTAVDHFQHLVYENPNATPQERREMWQQMEKTYLPWRDYGDLPHVKDGGFWQLQRHIYGMPFYYIDYVLAQICAFQFWARIDTDREGAMQDYVALCKRGGEAPFQELARGAGLKSPFEEGCLKDVATKAKDWLTGH
ncbi:MAG: M3 family oligoendopeptidase [Planctomycetota bacterium]